jgi:ribosomal protein S8
MTSSTLHSFVHISSFTVHTIGAKDVRTANLKTLEQGCITIKNIHNVTIKNIHNIPETEDMPTCLPRLKHN